MNALLLASALAMAAMDPGHSHEHPPQLGKLAHPCWVLVGEPDHTVHLGDRRCIQRDVPVRGAHHDGACAAHDDTAPSACTVIRSAYATAAQCSARVRPTL